MLRFWILVAVLTMALACGDSTRRRGGSGSPGGPRLSTDSGTGPNVDATSVSADGAAPDDARPALDAGDAGAPRDSGPAGDARIPDSGARADAAVPPADAGPGGCVQPRDVPGLVINEIDYDQPGTDSMEFVELFNGAGQPLCLGDVELVLVNGDSTTVYGRFNLSAAGPVLAPGGYLVLAGAALVPAGGALVAPFPGTQDQLQNGGPDGLLLRDRITGEALDALSYEGEIRSVDVDGTTYSLVEGLALGAQDNASTASLGRWPNGADTNNAFTDWIRLRTPTPGAANVIGSSDAGVQGDGGPTTDAGTIPRTGVYLYTGAGGGGPASDLDVAAVENLYRGANIPVTQSDVPPGDVSGLRLLAVLNPQTALPSGLVNAAQRLVRGGGRLLIVMEHCKNGCFGNASEANRLLMALPSSIRMSGQGGAPLTRTALSLLPVPPLTNGVSSLVVYYSGSVTPGTGTALGVIPGGDAVIAYEALAPGEVVAIADSSMLGFVLADADNRAFLLNLGR